MITQKRLKELFTYNKKLGGLYWKAPTSNAVKPGQRAGRKIANSGYISVGVDNERHQEHRLIWLFHYGSFPKNFIDHKNGVRDHNRIENLREATRVENQQNTTKRQCNTSGFLGVTHRTSGRWLAQIGSNGLKIHIGVYDTPEKAHAAYLVAKKKLHTFNPAPREKSATV